MMKRLMLLVTVALLMAAMLLAGTAPAMAAAIRPPIAGIMGGGGVPVDPAVCGALADGSAMFGWRAGGEVCWFTPPAL
jgi:hypothetical protein